VARPDGRHLGVCGIGSGGIRLLLALWCLAPAGCQSGKPEPAANYAGARGGPPRLLVPSSPLDLGQGLPGEELTGSVVLKNSGGELLRIERMEAGCGCALLNLSESAIAPGAEVHLQVIVRIKDEGQRLQFPIRIHSNDPVSPETVYTVRAEAAPPLLRTDPARIDFGEVPVGTAPIQRLKLLKPDGSPWPASEPVTSESARGLAQVDTGRQQGEARGESLVLDIRPRADVSAGSFSDTLTIRVPGSQRAVQVPVQGIVVPRHVVSPSGLYFGDVERQSGVLKRYALLRRTDGRDLNRVVKSTAPPGISLTPMEPSDQASASDRRRLLVTLDSSVVTQDMRDGKLLLWLEHEPEPLVIRVMVFLGKRAAPSEQ
jgi:hypothetical protein